MRYEENGIYHLFNRGYNRQVIFPQERNYSFFEDKLIKNVVPHADILSYCLMPNHFHLLLRVRASGCEISNAKGFGKQRMQNMSVAMSNMLGGYTRAINRQERRKGSLYEGHTKAVACWYEGWESIDDNYAQHRNQHANACLQYIHQNPVKAELSSTPEGWFYSSAKHYARKEDHPLGRVKLAIEFGLI